MASKTRSTWPRSFLHASPPTSVKTPAGCASPSSAHPSSNSFSRPSSPGTPAATAASHQTCTFGTTSPLASSTSKS